MSNIIKINNYNFFPNIHGSDYLIRNTSNEKILLKKIEKQEDNNYLLITDNSISSVKIVIILDIVMINQNLFSLINVGFVNKESDNKHYDSFNYDSDEWDPLNIKIKQKSNKEDKQINDKDLDKVMRDVDSFDINDIISDKEYHSYSDKDDDNDSTSSSIDDDDSSDDSDDSSNDSDDNINGTLNINFNSQLAQNSQAVSKTIELKKKDGKKVNKNESKNEKENKKINEPDIKNKSINKNENINKKGIINKSKKTNNKIKEIEEINETFVDNNFKDKFKEDPLQCLIETVNKTATIKNYQEINIDNLYSLYKKFKTCKSGDIFEITVGDFKLYILINKSKNGKILLNSKKCPHLVIRNQDEVYCYINEENNYTIEFNYVSVKYHIFEINFVVSEHQPSAGVFIHKHSKGYTVQFFEKFTSKKSEIKSKRIEMKYYKMQGDNEKDGKK